MVEQYYTVNIPAVDATLLVAKSKIYAVIDHTEFGSLYVYKKPSSLEAIEKSHKKFWRADTKTCYKTDINRNILRSIILPSNRRLREGGLNYNLISDI